MSDQTPTPDQILAALCTPPRDMRDEIWLRVYAQSFLQAVGTGASYEAAAQVAADDADYAVLHVTVPVHRRAEVGLP